jgi:hypothetical protein
MSRAAARKALSPVLIARLRSRLRSTISCSSSLRQLPFYSTNLATASDFGFSSTVPFYVTVSRDSSKMDLQRQFDAFHVRRREEIGIMGERVSRRELQLVGFKPASDFVLRLITSVNAPLASF